MVEVDPKKLDEVLLKALVALKDVDAIIEIGRSDVAVRRPISVEAVQGLKEIRAVLAGPKRPETKKKFQMLLESVGNPDHGQYAPVSNPKWVAGNTLKEMRKRAHNYQRHWELGGGNWTNPEVLQGKTVVGHFSYNLRFWDGSGDRRTRKDEPKEILI